MDLYFIYFKQILLFRQNFNLNVTLFLPFCLPPSLSLIVFMQRSTMLNIKKLCKNIHVIQLNFFAKEKWILHTNCSKHMHAKERKENLGWIVYDSQCCSRYITYANLFTNTYSFYVYLFYAVGIKSRSLNLLQS